MPVNRRAGFTLVELLVVIGVIVILVSLLMPVLRKAREQSHWAVCQSNLRQLGMAALGYRQANNGWQDYRIGNGHYFLPPFGGYPEGVTLRDSPWSASLLPYLGNNDKHRVFECPAFPFDAHERGFSAYAMTRSHATYKCVDPPNGGYHDFGFVRFARIRRPAQKHLYAEAGTVFIDAATNHLNSTFHVGPGYNRIPLTDPYGGDKQYAGNHFGPGGRASNQKDFFNADTKSKTIAVYWDGHVEAANRLEWLKIKWEDPRCPFNNN